MSAERPQESADVKSLVSLRRACKDYENGTEIVHALRDIDLDLKAGDFAVITGPSGSGKTSLLHIIGLMDSPTAGIVQLGGNDVGTFDDGALTKLRCDFLGFIFQSFNLFPSLTVFENIELPLTLRRHAPSKRVRREIVEKLIEDVGLTPWKKSKPARISGGQKQRTAIARSLVNDPRLVLADEPTANLDSRTGSVILELMRTLNNDRRTTFLFSTHDPMIRDKASRVIVMRDGRIVEDSTPGNAA